MRSRSMLTFCCMVSVVAGSAAGSDEALEAAWQRVCNPSTVTLDLRDASPREAYQRIAELSGNAMAVKAPDPWQKAAKPVTFSVVDEPFWQAIERVSSFAPATLRRSHSGRGLRLEWRHEPVGSWVAFPGPASVRLDSLTMEHVARTDAFPRSPRDRKEPRAELGLALGVEPRVHVERAGAELVEVIDDTGKNLVGPGDGGGRSTRFGAGRVSVSDGLLSTFCSMPVRFPHVRAKSIKTIKGRLSLTMRPDLPSLRVENLDQSGQQLRQAGLTLLYKGMTATDKGRDTQYVLSLVPSGPGLAIDGRGSVRWLRPDLLCEDGTKVQPGRWGGRTEGKFWFRVRGGKKPQCLVIRMPVAYRTMVFPFELRDVPLPSQTVFALARGPLAPEPASEPAAEPEAPAGFLPLSQMSGTRLTYHCEDSPITNVIELIAKQSGNPIAAPRFRSRRAEVPNISLSLEDQLFWRAIDAVATPWNMGSRPPYTIYLKHRPPSDAAKPPERLVRYHGAARISVRDVRVDVRARMSYRTRTPKASETAALVVSAQAAQEPKVNLVRHGLSVERCVVDGVALSRSLPDNNRAGQNWHYVNDPRCRRMHGTSEHRMCGASEKIPIQGWTQSGKLDALRLYYFAATYQEDREILVDATQKDQRFSVEDGVILHWSGQVEPSKLVFHLEVARDDYRINGKDILRSGRVLMKGARGRDCLARAFGRWTPRATRGGDDRWPRYYFMGHRNDPPAQVVFRMPRGYRVYAGYLDFKDVPAPVIE